MNEREMVKRVTYFLVAKCSEIRCRLKLRSSSKDMSQKPQLIVFDLDYTLWPYHVDSTVELPFLMKDSCIFDQGGQVIKPFPEVTESLEYLKQEGFTLAAASRTKKPPGALQLLTFLNWDKYFSYKEIYPGCKITHFQRFKEQTNLPYESMLFFDDEERNIREVSSLGVNCVFVPNGLNMELLKQALSQFKQDARS